MRAPGVPCRSVCHYLAEQCGLDPVALMCNSFPVEAPIIRMQVNRASHRLRMLLEAEVVAVHHILEVL